MKADVAVIDLWSRLEAYLRANAPDVLATLHPPVTDAAIRAAEAALGCPLPAELSASLRVHDGQLQDTGTNGPHTVPLVPEEFDDAGDSLATWGELLPLELIVSSTQRERQITAQTVQLAREFGEAALYECRGPVRRQPVWDWIDFVDAGTGDRLALDLNPAPGGTHGQVVSIVHDPSMLIVLSRSYRQWFEDLVTNYETGRYFFGEQDGLLTALDRFNPRG
jgi:cell wall assembly regulator SMI1